MADFPGAVLDITPTAAPPAPSPMVRGRSIVPKKSAQGEFAYGSAVRLGGAFGAGAGPGPPLGGGANVPGAVREATPGDEWFEKVHLLPRDPGLQFGNIVTTVTGDFEIFNAFRVSSDLTTFVNNAGTGISIPALPALPYTAGAFTSLLDPASVRVNLTVSGKVKLQVQADTEGPARFDDTLDFTWGPGGTLMLRVSGNRIVFFAAEPELPIREVLEFGVEILEKFDGTEQRISTRANPRQRWTALYRSTDLQQRELRALMFDWQGRQFGVPLWREATRVTAAITGGGTSTANVITTTGSEFRVGGLGAVFTDSRTFDVLTVASTTATSVVFTTAIQASYPVDTLVMPVRTAIIPSGTTDGARFRVNVEDMEITWLSTDNDTGALTGDTTPFGTYNGKVFLEDDCNLVTGDSLENKTRTRVTMVDGGSGIVFQDPVWERNKRSTGWTFLCQTRERLIEVRRLLVDLHGPQTSFYMPSASEDLLVTQALGSGSTAMVIENIGYTKFIQTREPKRTLRITFTDATDLIRVIQSSVETSATEETLTLDTTWPAARPVSEIARVEFIELVRVARDTIQITHDRAFESRVFFPVTTVHDV